METEVQEIFDHYEVKEVNSKKEAYDLIESHFGTLKCKSTDYELEDGELWEVYPPSGVSDIPLHILIKL
ncbi:MAG: hypothetical protein NXI00_22595 [Cytophagales bacterium]|nr:hypothetical protein [Cytophagales bacterium]